ncbi:MAG: tryptophan synthase subunit alpha [Pseudomonadota bacterium]
MTRIAKWFEGNHSKALLTFITAGDPNLQVTVPAMHALVAGGADIIELGIPFSDPEAEGPTIQASSERALENNVGLSDVLTVVAEFRETNQSTPVILMGYLNSVLAMTGFAEKAKAAGVDGLIMVNLPPEEAADIRTTLTAHDIDLIFLIAPTTTDERTELILKNAQGFVYYVSLKGITGADLMQADDVADQLEKLRSRSKLPVCVGFGIKDGATAGRLGGHADGVVVGSALVSLMAEGGDVEQICHRLTSAVAQLRDGLDHK